ncbi:MAG: GldG family protein, partial [Deltaproteobacteria bacterium]|nr:GldG family protein [Deltaproteobacteria bacterium]
MERLTRYAWAFGLSGLFCLLTFLALLFLHWGQVKDPWTAGFGIAAGVLLALYGMLDRETLERSTSSRAFRLGGGAVAMVLLAGAVGVAAFELAEEHDHRWDVSREKRFSLSEKSRKVAAELEREVEVYAFFSTGTGERYQFEKLMEGYQQASKKISVQFFDPLRHPRMADRFTVTSDYGTVVLVSGEDRQRLESTFHEEAVTHAIIRLMSAEDHRLCWAMGHGELDPDDDGSADGLGAVVIKLEDQNYTVTKSNVFTQGIERECELLVVARPTREWLPVELERLAVYLAEGGRVFVLLEPETVPVFAEELQRYGVTVGNDVIIEMDPAHRIADVEDPAVIALSANDYAIHPITEPLQSITLFWVARSVKGIPLHPGVRIHELLQASSESWGETTLDFDPENLAASPEAFLPTEGQDLIGNVPLMVAIEVEDPEVLEVGSPPEVVREDSGHEAPLGPAVEVPGSGIDLDDVSAAVPSDFAPTPGGRLVVVGDANFPSNRLLTIPNNQDLFTNTVAWLVEEEAQIAQAPEPEKGDTLTLTVLEGLLVVLVSVFLVPGTAV